MYWGCIGLFLVVHGSGPQRKQQKGEGRGGRGGECLEGVYSGTFAFKSSDSTSQMWARLVPVQTCLSQALMSHKGLLQSNEILVVCMAHRLQLRMKGLRISGFERPLWKPVGKAMNSATLHGPKPQEP